MPLLDITDPKIIKFLLENYEKESRLRLKWQSRHREQHLKAATFSGGEAKHYSTNDVNKHLMVAGMATITRDHAVAARHRFVAPTKYHQQAQLSAVKPLEPPMKSIQTEEKDLLRESRVEYMKARFKKVPEDKFNFVDCSSWNYGWKLDESELKTRGPAHGIVCHMEHTLKCRVGPTPDPDYYTSPDTTRTVCAS